MLIRKPVEGIERGQGSMADPELQGDEQILIRTPNVHVKSFSFEAILTNKRVILVDRLKNILPPKEIPLATIQSIEPGENEIREVVITLGVITKTSGTRQMVLTFSRRGGENRIRERDAWVRQIRAHLTPSFEPVIRKVIPGDQSTPTGRNKVTPYSSATVRSPVLPARPAGFSPPVKKIVKNPPESWQAPAQAPASGPETIFGTYCSRCGTKVPEGSGFCNTCGTRIICPGGTVQRGPVSAPAHSIPVSTAPEEHPLNYDIKIIEPLTGKSSIHLPRGPLRTTLPIPEVSHPPPSVQFSAPPVGLEHPAVAALPSDSLPAKKRWMPSLFSPIDLPPTLLVPSSMPATVPLSPKKPKNKKKIIFVAGVIVIILISVFAGAGILPKTGGMGSHNSSGSALTTTTTAAAVTTKSTGITNTTAVRSPGQWSPFPDRK